jgi:hypothetical protein
MSEAEKPRLSSPPWFAVALVVRSTHTVPDEITTSLGATPTTTHLRGERLSPRNPSSMQRTENVWTLTASVLETESLDDIVEDLLDRVSATPDLPADCSIELSLGLNARPMGNLVELGEAVVQRLAEVGAAVRLDVYESNAD